MKFYSKIDYNTQKRIQNSIKYVIWSFFENSQFHFHLSCLAGFCMRLWVPDSFMETFVPF